MRLFGPPRNCLRRPTWQCDPVVWRTQRSASVACERSNDDGTIEKWCDTTSVRYKGEMTPLVEKTRPDGDCWRWLQKVSSQGRARKEKHNKDGNQKAVVFFFGFFWFILGSGGQMKVIPAILPESLADVFRPLRVDAGEASLGTIGGGIFLRLTS